MFLLSSCGESSKERQQRELIDSLQNASAIAKHDYENLQRYLSVIANGLDSISLEEKEIFLTASPNSNEKYNKQNMKQQLDKVRDILARHRERINQLESQLADGQSESNNLRVIISTLKKQLEEKDKELAELRAELDDSKKSISELRTKMASMQVIQDNQQTMIEDQLATIEGQNEKLNKAYVKIATKKELKKLGLLSGGFLKKSKVDYSNIDLTDFETIDTSQTTNIKFPAKGKILTPVPEGSYSISNGTLTIIDAGKFWSLSNILIIQTD